MGIWIWIVPEKYRVSNRPLRSCLLPLCQNEPLVRNYSYENVFRLNVHFHAHQTRFRRVKSVLRGPHIKDVCAKIF